MATHTAAKRTKTAAKTGAKAPAKAVAQPVPPAADMVAHGGCGCASGAAKDGACCGTPLAGFCDDLKDCPLGKQLCSRSFWASVVVAFLVIFATDFLINNYFLIADYVATSAFWRTEGDIRSGLLVLTQAVTALAYAAVILGMGHAARWWGSLMSGMLAALPVAMVSVNTYAMMPFAETTIPAAWAATALGQGALVGVAICAALKAARAPEAMGCGCGPDCACGGACGSGCTCK